MKQKYGETINIDLSIEEIGFIINCLKNERNKEVNRNKQTPYYWVLEQMISRYQRYREPYLSGVINENI